jgi:glycosyltransferase involved in cell wall biosynthesis
MKKIVIIPAFNEEKKIAGIISAIKSCDDELEIAVIDDGSSDNTYGAAKLAGASALRLPFNMGYGNALQTGYKYAYSKGFDIVLQMDGDGQHDPAYIPSMIKTLLEADLDVLIGSRFKQKSGYKTSFARKAGIVFFGLIVSAILKKRITDPTSGYQAIRSSVLPFLVSEAFPNDYPDADLLIMLHYEGFKVDEFAMQMKSDPKDKSMHKGILKNIYYIFKMLMSIFLIVISVKIFNRKKKRGAECR